MGKHRNDDSALRRSSGGTNGAAARLEHGAIGVCRAAERRAGFAINALVEGAEQCHRLRREREFVALERTTSPILRGITRTRAAWDSGVIAVIERDAFFHGETCVPRGLAFVFIGRCARIARAIGACRVIAAAAASGASSASGASGAPGAPARHVASAAAGHCATGPAIAAGSAITAASARG